ncbi:hypothetical protein P152DRAFT_459644 [Eremomyces bilateralis CBS 781.70]|uniref:NADH-ubiquinone reductase complex 1 MLRQ subunit n=1 Tax=Eremomyces bilateralis CBS 781.70 TaxID=1392243 RepID=A0A6G1FZY7_9PEZI|nr:uncharacterized protein P152DRAFT_459644 [Eremomyces bilateralis CBS 781.70]KAF1811241.1 hypothetical protein P152DRAFT_459644 [Eremomyces bilateralis CBS 781.70]
MQATRALRMLPTKALRIQPTRVSMIQPSRRAMGPVPKEDQSAHTISQRIRTLKKIPPELIPLGVVLAVALGAAGYSLGNKLVSDKTLRLSRQGPAGQ